MKKKISLIITLAIFLSSCTTKKNTAVTEINEPDNNISNQIKKEGYIEALVEDKQNEGCGFILKNVDTKEYLIPVTLEDRFKINGQKVWLKYRPVRPIQTCNLGIPIAIDEIKIIE